MMTKRLLILVLKVPHDVKHQITHFGRNVMKYKVAEVVSTAQTLDGDKGAPLVNRQAVCMVRMLMIRLVILLRLFMVL